MTRYHCRVRNAVNFAYELLPQSGSVCVYCGCPADSVDHGPPINVVHSLGVENLRKQGIRLWAIPACRECNTILSYDNGLTVEDRKKELKRKLKRRYKRYLKVAHWGTEEMEEVGPTIRRFIDDGYSVKAWITERLKW